MKTVTTYTITIETESFINNSFMDNLRNEVSQEQREKDLTFKINEESSKILRIEFEKFIENINTLSDGYINSMPIENHTPSNNFKRLSAIIYVGSQRLALYADSANDSFEGTRYVTHTGFKVMVNGRERRYKVSESDILTRFKESIKKEISNNL